MGGTTKLGPRYPLETRSSKRPFRVAVSFGSTLRAETKHALCQWREHKRPCGSNERTARHQCQSQKSEAQNLRFNDYAYLRYDIYIIVISGI
jgi:hypothetical protein